MNDAKQTDIPLRDALSMSQSIVGEFTELNGETCYVIRHVDRMPPFLISLVSGSDHWMFIASNGGLTAGRVSADHALFPYITVDKIYDATPHTGSLTLVRLNDGKQIHDWRPFCAEPVGSFVASRNLYKNLLGNKLCFEEINHDLQLCFRYTWMSSDEFGFIRDCELINLGERSLQLDILDGLQNILPANTPRSIQADASNLVDAYKWTELERGSGIAMFTLYSGITDRAEPCESLRANSVFCLGLPRRRTLVSSEQVKHFKSGLQLQQEHIKRGVRGAYLVQTSFALDAQDTCRWLLVADVEKDQSEIESLRQQLRNEDHLLQRIMASVEASSDTLARIMGSCDGFQATAEPQVALHHYANVLFNTMRGGVFDDQYRIKTGHLAASIRHFNSPLYHRHKTFFASLPAIISMAELLQQVAQLGDKQVERLCYEFLPITFGRRHGDPSRPWNQFAIRLKDQSGHKLLSFEGNWRDIFQNWEALTMSFPEYAEGIIAKFVNASTLDGFNPYRITNKGIDWEVEDPEDPWSYIGYWGDHQIIYLLKLLELSHAFHPQRLSQLLHDPIYCYANVPYRIKDFECLIDDPKNTVVYDHELDGLIEQRVSRIGADGKLILKPDDTVYQVNLLEKLLVPLLSKLGNLVIDGGIWMNTQRPEWNDANNALVGQGLSMVTLFYLYRYVSFLQKLLHDQDGEIEITEEIAEWLLDSAQAIQSIRSKLAEMDTNSSARYAYTEKLGTIFGNYRKRIYNQQSFASQQIELETVKRLLADTLQVLDFSILHNQRGDGLFHAYNLLERESQQAIAVRHLYPMLEGQVAALSSGAIDAHQAIRIIEALFDSDLYRDDQNSFMLYPDRSLPGFLDKNKISAKQFTDIPVLQHMLDNQDYRLVTLDPAGNYRFNADLVSPDMLEQRIQQMTEAYAPDLSECSESIAHLYERVFNHTEFTGRSGGMFGFEGLGCIYWHMVSKLLLAVQETYFSALGNGGDVATCEKLGSLYYRVREGIGFNKSPSEYGAFPTDPYSHTPSHAGARQPGMTGQVKEEILTRFGELGLRVSDGCLHIHPYLLRAREFSESSQVLRYLDVENQWREIEVPEHGLAFTWWQVPMVFTIDLARAGGVTIVYSDGSHTLRTGFTLDRDTSAALFARDGQIRQLNVTINRDMLFEY